MGVRVLGFRRFCEVGERKRPVVTGYINRTLLVNSQTFYSNFRVLSVVSTTASVTLEVHVE